MNLEGVFLVAVTATAVSALAAQQSPPQVPMVPGLRVVTVLQFPEGDRESVVLLKDVSPKGVTYKWSFQQHSKGRDSSEQTLERFVSTADLTGAPRLNDLFTMPGRSETPGYTTYTISRATYARLLAEGHVPYSTVWVAEAPLGAGLGELLPSRRTLKGMLSLETSKPQSMPVLLNGRRLSLPALHLKGSFGSEDMKRETEFWVLADSAHPLILKEVNGPQVLETIRIDLPEADEVVERDLVKNCRAELPGIYFAFASARLESASEVALAGVAKLMAKHPDWAVSIEGHTDSIGNAAANQALSQRRADAVRSALVQQYAVGSTRLEIAGYGASHPKESNQKVEGRARNRRVELVRKCSRLGQ